jgi:hypothetical protein
MRVKSPYAVRVSRRGEPKDHNFVFMPTFEDAREVAKRLNEGAPKTTLYYAAKLTFRERCTT